LWCGGGVVGERGGGRGGGGEGGGGGGGEGMEQKLQSVLAAR